MIGGRRWKATFGTIEYLILKPAPAFPAFGIEHLLIDLVQMILFVGIGEEILLAKRHSGPLTTGLFIFCSLYGILSSFMSIFMFTRKQKIN